MSAKPQNTPNNGKLFLAFDSAQPDPGIPTLNVPAWETLPRIVPMTLSAMAAAIPDEMARMKNQSPAVAPEDLMFGSAHAARESFSPELQSIAATVERSKAEHHAGAAAEARLRAELLARDMAESRAGEVSEHEEVELRQRLAAVENGHSDRMAESARAHANAEARLAAESDGLREARERQLGQESEQRRTAEALELARIEERLPGGGVRFLEDRFRLIFDGEGRPERIEGIALDVTGRVMSEEERAMVEVPFNDGCPAQLPQGRNPVLERALHFAGERPVGRNHVHGGRSDGYHRSPADAGGDPRAHRAP